MKDTISLHVLDEVNYTEKQQWGLQECSLSHAISHLVLVSGGVRSTWL